MGDIYFLSEKSSQLSELNHDQLAQSVGVRGSYIEELSQIGLPIAPAAIIPSDRVKDIEDDQLLDKYINQAVAFFEQHSNHKLNSSENPLFCKIVLSPNFVMPTNSVHNVGLTKNSFLGYSKRAGEEFVLGEWEHLIASIFSLLSDAKQLDDWAAIKRSLADKTDKQKIDRYLELRPDLDDPKNHFREIIKSIYQAFKSNSYNEGIDFAVIIQMMVYGNWGPESYVGRFTTRDLATGSGDISGKFAKNELSADSTASPSFSIPELASRYLDHLRKAALSIENRYKEIREVNFTIEEGKLWIVDQKAVKISTLAHLRFLLNMHADKKVNDRHLIDAFEPEQLRELLHARIKPSNEKPCFSGGIAGSPGAASGKVYFSTSKFLDGLAASKLKGAADKQILAMTSTYAEDVQAIEIGEGVISSEGGFASHAPVVARSFGKPALVIPGTKFIKGAMILPDGTRIKEGDYISMDVGFDQPSKIYNSKMELIFPDVESNGLVEFVSHLKKYCTSFVVRCNADQAKDAAIGKKLGSLGIGLCRTEHMFFEERRIMILRKMMLVDDEERRSVLDELKTHQKQDFTAIMRVLNGDPFTVRLLDAPLHEFLPKDDSDYHYTYKYLKDNLQVSLSESEVISRLRFLSREINPMLGHRGCRLAITHPEIYSVQTEALLEAAVDVSKACPVDLEIMIPMVSLDREIEFIINGKEIEGSHIPGLLDVKQKVLDKYKLTEFKFPLKFGTMIELPGAVFNAAELAKTASFFSFGTNDLTQTTLGISRDDINSFYPIYSKFDIFEFNPFQKLNNVVKQMVKYGSDLGRLMRPDIKIGLCGEQGADFESIGFCIDQGLDYVSCSPYSVPVALLSVAKRLSLAKPEDS